MNNILHLKYAVEIARTGSISRAAENLYMSQPQLSKAIRELESSLGIKVFNRTSKGVSATVHGEEFLMHAKRILEQVKELERACSPTAPLSRRFSIAVPCVDYMARAFAEVVKECNEKEQTSFVYREANAARAVKLLTNQSVDLAIIRYPASQEEYYLKALAARGVETKLLYTLREQYLMSHNHVLAGEKTLTEQRIAPYTELVFGDAINPTLPDLQQEVAPRNNAVMLYGRANVYEMLSAMPDAILRTAPVSEQTMQRYGLVAIAGERGLRDMLVIRKGYELTALQEQFVRKVENEVKSLPQINSY